MPKPSTLQKYKDRLWDDMDTLPDLSETQRSQLLRFRAIIMCKLESPAITNVKLVKHITNQFGIKSAQAYRDIRDCEPFLVQIGTASKEYLRYMLVETQKEALAWARDAMDPEAVSKVNAVLGKYTKLDQDDIDLPDFSNITPIPTIFVNKPEIMGITNIQDPKAFVEKVKKQFIVDVDFEEVNE